MMSLQDIKHASDEAAASAARSGKKPYVPFNENEIEQWTLKIPMLGDYVPKGWVLVEELLCDSSGFGSEDEPALTIRELKQRMLRWEREGKNFGYAVTEAGQFQVRLGVYRRI